ncbi:hypothetical protein ACFX45_30345 [Streptomyces sp. YIM B13518]
MIGLPEAAVPDARRAGKAGRRPRARTLFLGARALPERDARWSGAEDGNGRRPVFLAAAVLAALLLRRLYEAKTHDDDHDGIPAAHRRTGAAER